MSNSSSSYFQSLRILHAAMLGGALLFLAVVRFVLLNSEIIDAASVDDPLLLYTPAVVMLLGILFGEFMFQRQIKEARNLPSLVDKLNAYRAASIVRWASMEGPVLFATVWFFLYADKYFMAIALVGMALLAFSRPIPQKTVQHLMLSEEESEKITSKGF